MNNGLKEDQLQIPWGPPHRRSLLDNAHTHQRLASVKVSNRVLRTFYIVAVESLPTRSIISWLESHHGTERCCPEWWGQQKRSSGPLFPGSQIFTISDAGPDFKHTRHRLFTVLPSGKLYQILYSIWLNFTLFCRKCYTLSYLCFFVNYSFSALKESRKQRPQVIEMSALVG